MTEDFYLSEMAYLCNYFNIDAKMQAKKGFDYWPLLKHMANEEFHIAVVGIIREFIQYGKNDFPLISHFLKFCSSDAQGQAVRAISTLKACIRSIGKYESVSFGDSALHAVVEGFGGWPAVCAFSDSDWNVNEGRMIEAYKTRFQSGFTTDDNSHLSGISEKDAGFYRLYQVDGKTCQLLQYQRFVGVNLIETVVIKKQVIEQKRTGIIENAPSNPS
jgi:hypothetical protein